MASQSYKIFPNKVELFKYFGQYNAEINVGISARLPMNGLALGTKLHAFRSFPEFYAFLAELTGLDVDTKASTFRMGTYIVFFNPEVVAPAAPLVLVDKFEEVAPVAPAGDIDIEAILAEAKALNDESDKQASKAKLVEFAASKGVVLKGNKTFEKLLAELESALKV